MKWIFYFELLTSEENQTSIFNMFLFKNKIEKKRDFNTLNDTTKTNLKKQLKLIIIYKFN